MATSVTAAYRADVGRRGGRFGIDDDIWLTVGSLLGHAASVGSERRAELLASAADIAHSLVARDAAAPPWRENESGLVTGRVAELVMAVAENAAEAGALQTARTILSEMLLADESLTTRERGRLLAQRARVDGRSGALRDAADQYREVARLGRIHRDAELRARAYIGMGSLAQMRGNYPEQQRWATRAAHAADRYGFRQLSRFAHEALMITLGLQRRFEEALAHARKAYSAARGRWPDEIEVLNNFGQLLMDAGHPELAGAVFRTVVKQTLPVRLALPAIGGLAMAAARTRDVARVDWAAQRVQDLAAALTLPYSWAAAALECAAALEAVGRSIESRALLERATTIAREHGYHEITIKAEDLANHVAPVEQNGSVERVAARLVRDIVAHEPAALAVEVSIAGAPGQSRD